MLLITRREFARSLKVFANSRYKMSPTAFPRGLADSRAGRFRLKFQKTCGENHTPPSPLPKTSAEIHPGPVKSLKSDTLCGLDLGRAPPSRDNIPALAGTHVPGSATQMRCSDSLDAGRLRLRLGTH